MEATPAHPAPRAQTPAPAEGGRRIGLRCIRCGTAYAVTAPHFGCPACEPTQPANLEVVYADPPRDGPALRQAWPSRAPGLWRYGELLPVDAAGGVRLGEGGTPLIACARLGDSIGLPRLSIKWEAGNPTWSFKDRLAAMAVAWARSRGLPGVAVSSSGNAGAAVAAYAARAGLPCLVLTTRAFPGSMQRLMDSYGAMVVALPTAPDRWRLNRAVARDWGWLPVSNVADPPVGSHPVAIEAYKTIAFEIAQDLGWQAPDAVVVPVGYGDAIAGIGRGFAELQTLGLIRKLPRLIAAETYGSLSQALAGGAEGPIDTGGSGSAAASVAVPQGTYQALRAIRASAGEAVAVADGEARAARRELALREGLLAELSSALPLAAARRLAAKGALGPDEQVVLLVTSSGVKDLGLEAGSELPLVEPSLADLRAVLRERYGHDAG